MKLNFLFPFLGFVVGILLSDTSSFGSGLALIFVGLALIAWLLLHIISTNPIRGMRFSGMHVVWVSLIFAGLGSLVFDTFSKPYISKDINGEYLKIRGIVKTSRSLAERDDYQIKVLSIIDKNGETIHSRNLGILLKTNGFSAKKGDIIEFSAKIQDFLYGNTKVSSYTKMMNHRGILYHCTLKADKIYKTGHSFSIFEIFENLREEIIIKLEKSSLSREATGFVISLLLGDRSFLPTTTKETLTSAGLSHIMALSGLHVGIVLVILYGLTIPVRIAGREKVRCIIVLTLLWCYVFLSGSSPSTVRAAIMGSMIIIALMLQRKNSSLNALFIATFIILLFDPNALWDVGLQMSFLCVFSIIVFANKFNPVDQHLHPLLFKMISLILLSLIVTATTWVVMAYYFHKVPILFLPANVLLLPFLPFFILSAVSFIICLGFGFDPHFLSNIINHFHDIFIESANLISAGGKSNVSLNIDSISVILWIFGIMILAFAIYSSVKKRKYIYFSIGFFLCSFSIVSVFNNQSDEKSLIFQHSFTELQAKIIEIDKIHNLAFPRNTISKSIYESSMILAIDNVIKKDSIEKLKEEIGNYEVFLLIGPGADFSQIATLIEDCVINKIVLHSTIGKNMKQEILDAISAEHHKNIYSLRENGSLSLSI